MVVASSVPRRRRARTLPIRGAVSRSRRPAACRGQAWTTSPPSSLVLASSARTSSVHWPSDGAAAAADGGVAHAQRAAGDRNVPWCRVLDDWIISAGSGARRCRPRRIDLTGVHGTPASCSTCTSSARVRCACQPTPRRRPHRCSRPVRSLPNLVSSISSGSSVKTELRAAAPMWFGAAWSSQRPSETFDLPGCGSPGFRPFTPCTTKNVLARRYSRSLEQLGAHDISTRRFSCPNQLCLQQHVPHPRGPAPFK